MGVPKSIHYLGELNPQSGRSFRRGFRRSRSLKGMCVGGVAFKANSGRKYRRSVQIDRRRDYGCYRLPGSLVAAHLRGQAHVQFSAYRQYLASQESTQQENGGELNSHATKGG